MIEFQNRFQIDDISKCSVLLRLCLTSRGYWHKSDRIKIVDKEPMANLLIPAPKLFKLSKTLTR